MATKLFFTSDTHFGHKGIIHELNENRPFNNIEEHDNHIITQWNKTVGKDDIVWHLGDFAYRNKKPIEWYTKKLNGRIHLIKGNHDDKSAWKTQYLFASTQNDAYLKYEGYKIHLYHYPLASWRASNRGSWHLHGHCHGNMAPVGKRMDVGTSCNGYKPVSFEEIQERLKDEPDIDHHAEKENPIQWVTPKLGPVDTIKPGDIPSGLSAEDVATDTDKGGSEYDPRDEDDPDFL